MKKNTSDMITHLLDMAKVSIPAAKVAEYQDQLSQIIAYFQEINELPVDDIQATVRANSEKNVWRDDRVQPSLSQTQALSNAREPYKGYFLVNCFLDKET